MVIPNTIAIDGPAGSGKSTLGWKLAEYLGYLCLDTGVMYRAVTWAALDRGIEPKDEMAVSELAWHIDIDVQAPAEQDSCTLDVFVDGENVTNAIRSEQVEANVSRVSAYPQVREAMTMQQRRIGKRGKIIMIGRDIGTVVLPDAELKIYLVASVKERAYRRYEEKKSRGEQTNLEEIQRALIWRDQYDSTREIAPMQPAADAVILDSDGLNVEEVFEAAKRLFE